MAGIIDYLKARQARGAAMLHPGKSTGSGSGLLLKSSSLQPQTVFRQTKASFSVKRPSMTVLNLNRISSFSEKAEMKYTNSQSLMHIRPSSSGSASTVQRAPASMPLPVAGGAPVVQPVSENPVSMPSMPSSPVSMPSYPPKSERRPVVFDRSDGPSDFEKRLMAAKKQKAAQEAKQRGPDRRRVRTERVEISQGSSNEIQREILNPNAESLFQKITREVQRAAAGGQQTEHNHNLGSDPHKVQSQPLSSAATANTVQRESSDGDTSAQTEIDTDPHSEDSIQREFLQSDTKSKIQTPVLHEPRKSLAEVKRELLKKAEPAEKAPEKAEVPAAKELAPAETVQREPLKTAGPVMKAAETTEVPVAKESAPAETVQREPLKTAGSVMKVAEKTEAPAAKESAPAETVQREPLKTAEPVMKAAEKTEVPAAKEPAPAETVQREPLKTAGPVMKAAEKTDAPAANESAPAETVQHEPLKTAGPVTKAAEKTEVPAAKEPAPAETVQREPLKIAEPVMKAAEKTEVLAAIEPAPTETVQREPLKTAEPVTKAAEKTEAPAAKEPAPAETVQREPLKTAEPVMKAAEKAEVPAVKEPVPAETIQRVPLKTSEPVTEAAEKTEVPVEEEPAETIQREPLKKAEPVMKAAEKTKAPAAKESAPAEIIQREPLKAAEPVMKAAEKAEAPAVNDLAETVQREPLKTAEPVTKAAEKTEIPVVKEPASAETIQREPLKTAVPVTKAVEKTEVHAAIEPAETVQREPLKTAEPVVKAAEKAEAPAVKETVSAETLQREPLKTAEPVTKAAEKAETPAAKESAEIVQREPLKTAEPVTKITEKAEAPTLNESAETVQREPLKRAEPVTEAVEKTEVPAAKEPAETIQREPLKTAEPITKAAEKVELPVAKKSASVETVQREPLTSTDTIEREIEKAAPVSDKVSDTQSKAAPAKEKSVRPEKAENKASEARLIQRSFDPEKKVSASGEPEAAAEVIQRERQDNGKKSEIPSAVPTVEREPYEDLTSLLSRLPTHYEMPKAQIEAIRSGKPYTGNKGAEGSSRETVVNRQYTKTIPQPSEQKKSSENVITDGKAAEAAVHKTVQREPALVLPKQQKHADPVKGKTEQTVQRENETTSAVPNFSGASTGKMPGASKKPHDSFGQNGFMGIGGFGTTNNGFFGGQPGLIQREPLESSEPDTVQRAPISATETAYENKVSSDEISEDVPKTLTARELDTLADKLVPRIKRMMRAEMERNVFR